MFDPATLLRPAFREYADRLTSIPPLAWQSLTYYLAAPWKRSLFESLQGLSKAIPTGLFDNRGVDRTLTQFFSSRPQQRFSPAAQPTVCGRYRTRYRSSGRLRQPGAR